MSISHSYHLQLTCGFHIPIPIHIHITSQPFPAVASMARTNPIPCTAPNVVFLHPHPAHIWQEILQRVCHPKRRHPRLRTPTLRHHCTAVPLHHCCTAAPLPRCSAAAPLHHCTTAPLHQGGERSICHWPTARPQAHMYTACSCTLRALTGDAVPAGAPIRPVHLKLATGLAGLGRP